MTKFDDSDGVWRTIGGRRVFIRTGQSLSDAMKESGKFGKREAVTKERMQEDIDEFGKSAERYQKSLNRASNPESKRRLLEDRDEALKRVEEAKQKMKDYDNPKEYKGDTSKLEGKHIAKEKEYHFAGEELYSDDPHRYDDTIKSAQARKEKFKADSDFKKEKHIGWGDYNKDGIPVYNNEIDYKGDFGWANLETLTDDDLTKALNVQSEEYHKATAESVGDGRTRNGRMDRIFKNAKVGKYEQGMDKINAEMQKRDMPRYNIYDKQNPNIILVSSPTKEMADKQIQDMYKTDVALQKEYGWKELPKYDYKVGKVDENLNEIKKDNTINNTIRQKAYQKYLKEHPNSKLTFNEFKDMRK